jgi:hypothetical protein
MENLTAVNEGSPSSACSAFLWGAAIVVQTLVSWVGWLFAATLIERGLLSVGTDVPERAKSIASAVLLFGMVLSVLMAWTIWKRRK